MARSRCRYSRRGGSPGRRRRRATCQRLRYRWNGETPRTISVQPGGAAFGTCQARWRVHFTDSVRFLHLVTSPQLPSTKKWCYTLFEGRPALNSAEPTGSGDSFMFKRFVLAFAILGLAAASAATYRVTLSQPSKIEGKQLKAGEYRLNVAESKVTIVSGKESVEVPVKVKNGETKFDSNSIRYTGTGDKVSIQEIRLGGTKTTLLFVEQTGL